MNTALIVDDEPQMTMIIGYALETEKFSVLVAHDGATALHLLRSREVDLVVLDVLMPTMDGLTVCRRIRARSNVPIMMLTALTGPGHAIPGLECGADDYVTKPFHPRELALRAAALVRRRGTAAVLRIGELTIDRTTRTTVLAGTRLDLPDTQFRLLVHLAAHRGTPQSTRELLRDVWGTPDSIGGGDTVKTTVSRLRSHLIAAAERGGDYVQNIRGVGYLMPDLPPDPR